jgi:uncharacterized RDD family membrane protein YckC
MIKRIMDNINFYKGKISSDKKYAGFFIRILAGVLDWLFFALFILIIFLIENIFREIIFRKMSKNFWIIPQIVTVLFEFIYNIIIPKYFGGTLGKLILGIEILKINFQKIGFKESFLRYFIILIWVIYNSIINIKGILYTTEDLYNGLNSLSEWQNYLKSIEPKFTIITTVIINIWIFSEYIILLFNKEKKGLQDYMAGTIIVNKRVVKGLY